MSDETNKYNGWANYETWCVHLWLTNEEGDYRYWREEAARHRKEAPRHANVREGIWSVELAERVSLAEEMKSEIEEASPIEGASLFSDLLNGAISEVDWQEVADAFLEEVEPDPRDDDDQADEDEEDGEEQSGEAFEQEKRERIESRKEPLFELGQVVSTPGALEALTREDIVKALARHHRGDWGDVGRHDWQENEASLREGFRLLSIYRGTNGTKFWIITEADRSSTCVLLPSEY
jgi:uncharacterized membrane protein YkoI